MPYDPEQLWTYRSTQSRHEIQEPLRLLWEPNWSSMGEDYDPREFTAVDVWNEWLERVNWEEEAKRLRLPIGHVSIYWMVVPAGEGAPFTKMHPADDDFLKFYTWPVDKDGNRAQWTRCPVEDYEWEPSSWHKSGFVQAATGWKPSPLQRAMDVVQVAKAAGLVVPTFG